MAGRHLKLCIVTLLLYALTFVNSLDSAGFNTLRELHNQHNIDPLCNCSMKLIPKVEDVHDVLWVLSGIAETAQANAALNLQMHRKDPNNAIDARATDRANVPFGQARFLDRLNQIIPSIEQIHNSITRFGVQVDQRSSDSLMEDLAENCPYHSTVILHETLKDEVTEAVHFMVDVEVDENLAEATLLSIRMMVVEMNKRTQKFQNLLNKLKSLPCSEGKIKEGAREVRVRSFGESHLDCSCVRQLLPEARKLQDLLSWVLLVLEQTQAHALLTISQNPTGRAYPGGYEYMSQERLDRAFHGGEFYGSFRSEAETPEAILGRSALASSGGRCPVYELVQYREKLDGKMNDALHYREDVKGDATIAQHILDMVNDSVDEVSRKLEEYYDFTKALENRNCWLL